MNLPARLRHEKLFVGILAGTLFSLPGRSFETRAISNPSFASHLCKEIARFLPVIR